MRWLRELGAILKETGIEWLEDGIPSRGAALSYYVLLSLGPLLVIVVGILQLALTSHEAREGVIRILRSNVGPRAADTVATMLQRVQVPDLWGLESILTIALLLFGATAAFANVRGALDTIWGSAPTGQSKKEMVLDQLRARVRGFLMVMVTGLVISVSFVVTSGADVLADLLAGWNVAPELLRAVNEGVSFLLIGLLFGGMYRTLPRTRIEWSTVWVGAFATAFLFLGGKSLVTWIISSASWTSYYGPGASVVAFLVWIYFSSQIFFLGAEFTQVWSRRRGGVMSQREDGH